MSYNNHFTMKALFSNPALRGVLPQFYKGGSRKTAISNSEIFKRSQRLINTLLGGRIDGDKIVVEGKSTASVMSIVNRAKTLLETMFNNIDKFLLNVQGDQHVYTTLATVSQLKNASPKEVLKILDQVLENLNYNPDFKSQNVVQGAFPVPYRVRQTRWEKKVRFKRKEERKRWQS